MTPAPFKLDPEAKKKWVEALRSGEYEQGRGRLHSPLENSFCCMGVARAINIATGNCRKPNEWLTEDFLPGTVQGILARKNDAGDNFSTIATWIEDNL